MARFPVPLRGLRLPRGRTLDAEVWESRHRWLLALLAVQGVAIAADSLRSGGGPGETATLLAPVAALALVAARGPRSRSVRSVAMALGLLTESAIGVHLADGATAAHFHVFAMLAVLSLYEDTVPFLAAVAFAVIERGVVGTIDPGSVYTEAAAMDRPWVWAAIHGAFMAAAAGALLLTWNANERVRARLRRAERRAREERDRAAQLLRELEAAAEVTRSVARANDARATVAEAARALTGATFVVLAEPSDDGELELTVGSGMPDVGERRIPAHGCRSGAVTAFEAGEALFVPDAPRDERVSPGLVAATGAASLLFQPAISGDAVRGVVCIGWGAPRVEPGEDEARVAALLADEAALAIERAGELRDLEAAATTDALTGVANRRAWDRALEDALAAAMSGATRRAVTICLLDLDGFKTLNDTQGHLAGDRALKGCVAAWRAELRSPDLLARLGGDEFGVLLPGCDRRRAEAIRERLEAFTPHAAGVSVGVAEWTGDEPALALMQRADRNLYERKAARR